MSKAEKIKAEIDRLQSSTLDENSNFRSQYDQGIFDGLSLLEDYIDSLEEEPISNDLEEAAKNYEEDAIFYAARRISDFFIAGAQWQKEQMIDKACEWLAKHWREYVWLTDNDVIHFGHWEYDFRRAMEE